MEEIELQPIDPEVPSRPNGRSNHDQQQDHDEDDYFDAGNVQVRSYS